MFQWLSENRLFDLARQGQRLTHIAVVIPLGFLMPFFAQFAAIPLFIVMALLYGFPEGSISLKGEPAWISGLWAALFLLSSFSMVFVFLWLWTKFFEKRPFFTLGYEVPGALVKYLRGLLLGALMFGGAVGLMAAFGFTASEEGDPAQQGLAALGGVLIVFLGWMVQGAAEEALTRGWILPVLGARYRPWVGILVSSLIFAILHGLNPNLSVIAMINLALFGVFAALYALREGSLWGISALHSVWNWVQGNFFGFEVSGSGFGGGTLLNLMETGPDWITGGAFGPEGGLAVTAVLILGMLAALFWPKQAAERQE
jgi:hypothetical protein